MAVSFMLKEILFLPQSGYFYHGTDTQNGDINNLKLTVFKKVGGEGCRLCLFFF